MGDDLAFNWNKIHVLMGKGNLGGADLEQIPLWLEGASPGRTVWTWSTRISQNEKWSRLGLVLGLLLFKENEHGTEAKTGVFFFFSSEFSIYHHSLKKNQQSNLFDFETLPGRHSTNTFTNFSVSSGSLIGQWVKNLPVMQETPEMKVWFLGQEDPLEKEMATHSSILAWKVPWIEDPHGLQSKGSQRVRHDQMPKDAHRFSAVGS